MKSPQLNDGFVQECVSFLENSVNPDRIFVLGLVPQALVNGMKADIEKGYAELVAAGQIDKNTSLDDYIAAARAELSNRESRRQATPF